VDEYVRYDVKGKNIENQMSLVIKEAADMIYIIPVTEVAVGDILKVKDSYCQVISIDKEGALKVANYKTGTTSNVLKETNIFGFNLYYKVVSLFDQTNNKTAAGFNPMMLMLLSDKTGGSGKMDKLLPLMLMSNTTGTAGIPQPKLDKDGKPVVDKDGKLIYDTVPVPANPMAQMLPLMLMGGDGGFDMKDMLMMQMLGGQGGMFGGAAGGQGINPMMLMCLMDKSNSGGKKVPF
jgi:hypothetical protein